MHPVITDNLADFSTKAEDLAASDLSRKATNEFVLAGYRLYRNFAVLLAAGHLDFAEETARAILAVQTLEAKEALPSFAKGIKDLTVTVDIDDLPDDFDFGAHMLVYDEGLAKIQKFDFPFAETADDEEDTEEEGEADAPTAWGEAEANEATEAGVASGYSGAFFERPAMTGTWSGRTATPPCMCGQCQARAATALTVKAQAIEDGFNEEFMNTHDGEEPSEAQQDFHRLLSLKNVGLPLTDDEKREFADLRAICVNETVQRIVRQKRADQVEAWTHEEAAGKAKQEAAREADVAFGETMANESVEKGMGEATTDEPNWVDNMLSLTLGDGSRLIVKICK